MPPRASIFRREALEHQQNQWLGGIRLGRPLSLGFLTGFVLLVAGAVGSFLYVGEYTRKARVAGVLVPESGVIRLLPPQDAVVVRQLAVEGTRVRQGDVLFELSLERNSSLGDTQAAVQRSLDTRERSLRESALQTGELLRAQAAAIDQRIADMQRERGQLAAEADLQRQRLTLAQQSLARWESLRGENFVSPAQVQTKTEELLGLQAQTQALERQRAAHDRELTALLAQKRELPLQARARQGEIERDLADIAQRAAETEARRSLVMRAPQDGVLSTVLAQPGQTVSPTAALASLVPAQSRLLAHLYAPSSAVGFLRPHQTVLLRYQAFPYQKFGHYRGEVMQVSLTPLQAAEQAVLNGAAAAEPMYRITVALDRQDVDAYGQPQPLVAGMQLDADVLLDRRRLIEWIFEPLLGMAGRV